MAKPKNSIILLLVWLLFSAPAWAESKPQDQAAQQTIDSLEEPLYNPFTERYILDEVKFLRQMMADLRVEMVEKMTDREISATTTAVRYATDTITYFFYLIAAASTIFVLIGWSSLRDIKERAGDFANDEIKRITTSYEKRLDKLEEELHHKSRHIAQAQEEIELTNEIHSLWLKATQENTPEAKIGIYDQILQLRSDDVEALTYKADAAVELGQVQWAMGLVNQALEMDPENSHALYQRACAYAELDMPEEALADLQAAISQTSSLRILAGKDDSFTSLHDNERFMEMVISPEESA